jgi:signal transduction histidine kinase
MMLIVVSLTGIALVIAQRNVAENFETQKYEEFQGQIIEQHAARDVRLAVLGERCRRVVESRIRAAVEDEANDLLYKVAQVELPDALANDASADVTGAILHPRFYRFLDQTGAVIPPPEKSLGSLDTEDTFNDRDLALRGLPQTRQVGFVSVKKADGTYAVDEVIATPIFSRNANAVVAALVIGFRPIEFTTTTVASGRIKSGIWLNSHVGSLYMPDVAPVVIPPIAWKLTTMLTLPTPAPNGGSFTETIEGVPHLVIFEQINPGSGFPPAYEVSLYSLADALKRQRELRWEILGIGLALMLAGLVASHILSTRLSKPVETLEVVSAENVVQRERAEAALQVKNEELRTRNAELQKALADLEAAQQHVIQQERLRALGQMASGIAHDFNNALVPILGFCELLQLSPQVLADRKKCLGYLETIQMAAKDAASIVARLREFYRANKPDEEFGAVYLNRLVNQAMSLTQPKWKDQVQASGITIQVVTDLAEVPPVHGEESALREVLTNLIFNAVDAMPTGGTISIRTRSEKDRVVFDVIDSGTGMTEEVRRRCLEPFFSTKGERGTGLGLSMVFGIVQRHGGTIDLRSEVGRGTTFHITLPVYREEEVVPKTQSVAAPRSLRVLVVDDEAPVRELLSAALAEDGHQVEVADQGVEGLRRFMAGKFDLVVTDKAMPGMSGDQMATAIKQVAPHTPIILLTGFGQFLDKEKLPSVDVLAPKPIGVVALRDAVARALAASS